MNISMNSSVDNFDNNNNDEEIIIVSNKSDYFRDKDNDFIFEVYKSFNGKQDELSDKFYDSVKKHGVRIIKLKIGQETNYSKPYSERKTPKHKPRKDKGIPRKNKQITSE